VVCWGDADGYGQLGNGSFSQDDPFPPWPSGGAFASDGASIGLGSFGSTSCALDANEVAECWGFNSDGEAGNGTTANTGTPGVVKGL
jgi:hypothetical protein